MKLHLFCTTSCPVVFSLFPGNSHGAREGRKLIGSIHSKNSNYLLIDRAYEDDKTLAKTRGFHIIVPPKTNRKFPWLYDKQLHKQRNIIE